MRQSSAVLLAIFAAVSLGVVVQRRDDQAAAWDPTTRDWTKKCTDQAQFAGENFCQSFEFCCTNDPLNGDKCQTKDPVCVYDNEAKKVQEARCTLSNCTVMITTTPPPTTPGSTKVAPNHFYSVLAWAASVFLLLI